MFARPSMRCVLVAVVGVAFAVTAPAQEPATPPLPAAVAPEPCPAVERAAPARWYAGVDVLWLARDYAPNTLLAQRVVLDSNFRPVPLAGAAPLTTANVTDGTAQPGLRVGVGYRLTCATSVELGYFGLQEWGRSFGTLGGDPPFVNSPYLGTSIIYGNKSFDTRVTARYDSQIHSAEANLRRSFGLGGWHASALGGFRYFSLSEQLGLTGMQTFPNVPEGAPPVAQTIVEQTRTTTENNLFGAQIGAEFGRGFFDDRVALGVNGKVGLFANSANQFTTNGANLATGAPGTTVLAAGRGHTDLASLYEGRVTTTLRVTSRITLRAGYQVLFVQGLALAPTQLAATGTAIQQSFVFVPGSYVPRDFSQPIGPSKFPAPGTGSGLDTSGNLFLHGPFVGLGVSY